MNVRTRGEYTRDVEQYLDIAGPRARLSQKALNPGRRSQFGGAFRFVDQQEALRGQDGAPAAADSQGPEVRRGIEAAVSTVKGMRQARGAIRSEKMLTAAEVQTLLAALSPRGQGFVRFLYATGCRISEALGVRLTDCHVNGGVTIEVTGKGGKARKVRLARDLFDEIRLTFNGSTWLFESSKGNPIGRPMSRR